MLYYRHLPGILRLTVDARKACVLIGCFWADKSTESGPQTAGQIAEQVKTYNQALARVKAMCEGK